MLKTKTSFTRRRSFWYFNDYPRRHRWALLTQKLTALTLSCRQKKRCPISLQIWHILKYKFLKMWQNTDFWFSLYFSRKHSVGLQTTRHSQYPKTLMNSTRRRWWRVVSKPTCVGLQTIHRNPFTPAKKIVVKFRSKFDTFLNIILKKYDKIRIFDFHCTFWENILSVYKPLVIYSTWRRWRRVVCKPTCVILPAADWQGREVNPPSWRSHDCRSRLWLDETDRTI